MVGKFLLVMLLYGAWRVAHTATFLRRLAELLGTEPRGGPFRIGFWDPYIVAGQYRGRAVDLQYERPTKYVPGALSLTMAVQGPLVARIRRESVSSGLRKRLDLAYDDETGDSELDAQYIFNVNDSSLFKSWMTDESVRRTVFSLLYEHDLLVDIRQGSLSVTWNRLPFLSSTGRFGPAKWRRVLDDMHLLAESLERRPGLSPSS